MKSVVFFAALLIAALMVMGAAPSFVVSPDKGTTGAYSVLEPPVCGGSGCLPDGTVLIASTPAARRVGG